MLIALQWRINLPFSTGQFTVSRFGVFLAIILKTHMKTHKISSAVYFSYLSVLNRKLGPSLFLMSVWCCFCKCNKLPWSVKQKNGWNLLSKTISRDGERHSVEAFVNLNCWVGSLGHSLPHYDGEYELFHSYYSHTLCHWWLNGWDARIKEVAELLFSFNFLLTIEISGIVPIIKIVTAVLAFIWIKCHKWIKFCIMTFLQGF